MDCGIREKDDRISELPVFLLHRILSYLPRKDAAISSVLSKRWNSVWHSFPILKFAVTDYIKERRGTPEFTEKFEKFLNLVDKSLQNFTQNKLRMDVFCLKMSLSDEKYIPMVNTWIPLALHNGASRISVSFDGNSCIAGTGEYPLPETTFNVKSICGSSRFYRLQKLDLDVVCLSEDIVRDIICNCPNISDLCLLFFRGLKTLEISKLEKLNKLRLGVWERELECLSVDAPLLENFELFACAELHCVINLISCCALKRLKLSMCNITDDLLNSYISMLPLLEHLQIKHCHMLQRIRISAQRLKILELSQCGNLEVVQIHAPNLSNFEFSASQSMPILFSENVIPCSVKIYYGIRHTFVSLDSFWFLKLRELLGVSARGVLFSLTIIENEVSFDREALRDVAIPPLASVDRLHIRCRRISAEFDCDTFIDCLLWSCHPKEIYINPCFSIERNCIRVLREKLCGSWEQPLCCKLSHIKCWRHCFKSAKIENFEGMERYESPKIEDFRKGGKGSSLESLSLLEEGQEVRFILEWDL